LIESLLLTFLAIKRVGGLRARTGMNHRQTE
jgi:hypothetical protein